MATALPGDVITLANGIYAGRFGTGASGTAANPIVIRGASRDGVILDGGGCTGCNIIDLYGSFAHVEQLTLRNAERAIRFQTSGAQGIVVRRVHITNVTERPRDRAHHQPQCASQRGTGGLFFR
jgi:hypothetical protein